MDNLGPFTLTPELVKTLQPTFEDQEGRVPYIYADTRGNPTVGIGHLLREPCDAMRLPFCRKDGTPATQAEIGSAYGLVRSTRTPCQLVCLSGPAIDAIFAADLLEKARLLYRNFGNESIPRPAVLALFDMAFNLGGFYSFPKLRLAVLTGDWKLAAAESHREGIAERRNMSTRKLFLEAAQGPQLPTTQKA